MMALQSCESYDRDDMERGALRLLCSVLIKPGTRVEICRLLDPGVFVDTLRRTVFEEIRALGFVESRRLRELLPARVTNRGFPGFDLAELLGAKLASEAEIEKLFESVLRLLEISDPVDPPLFESENDVPN